jgi:ketosteroid isomerase-like protein
MRATLLAEMKRSDALAPLSRDHHHALVAAQALIRADEAGAAEAAHTFVEFFDADGSEHFDIEEALILPAAVSDNRGSELVDRVMDDHRELRAAAAQLRSGPIPAVERLHDVGARLRAHVRLEERELFPHLEETLPEERLLDLGQRLEAVESGHGGGGAADSGDAAADVVRRFLDAFTRRDLDALLEAADPEVDLHPLRLTGPAAYEGHAGIRRWMEEIGPVTSGISFAVDHIRGLGDDRVIAHVRLIAPPDETPVTAIFHVRDESIVSARGYFSDEKLLSSVGAL